VLKQDSLSSFSRFTPTAVQHKFSGLGSAANLNLYKQKTTRN